VGVPLFDPAAPLAGLRRRLGEALDEVVTAVRDADLG
jgi:hypothetical protein